MNPSQAGKRAMAFAAAALLMSAMALAQQQQPGQQPGQQPSQQPGAQPGQPTMPGEPGYPEAGVPGTEQMSQSFADQAFIHEALTNSTVEARMSLIAEQKSPSSDVQQYGQHMVLIHNQLNNQMKPLAAQFDVSENPKPTKKQAREIDKLKTLSGPAFDQAYLRAMAKEQKQDVKEFKSEATSAQTPALQEAARMDAPVLSQHLKALEEIAMNHNVALPNQ